ncbi:MAG: DUF697 domain-containing protein [Lactobacillaceae bacterium]|jgi:uncharacterized protein (DUF697 family)|nr:DUF697 domain-containing protein [Lactobacillaceae bacterium]
MVEFKKQLDTVTNKLKPNQVKAQMDQVVDGAKNMTPRQKAAAVIHTAAVTSAGIGAAPVPFADEAVIVPAQVAMISSLYKIYGRELKDGFARGVSLSTLATTFAKLTLGNLMKIVPGIGSLAGGAINASFAATITETMGWKIVDSLEKGEDVKPKDIQKSVNAALKLLNLKQK